MDQPKISAYTHPTKPWSMESKKHQEAVSLLGEWLTAGGVPYSAIEHEAFTRYCAFLNPCFQVPSEKTIRKVVVPEMYKKVRQVVQRVIDESVSKCSFTMDFWTSQYNHAFSSFAIHFLTNAWEQKVATLECLPFDVRHTSENISDEIQLLVNEWSLSGKIHAAVTDNASNLVNAVEDCYLPRIPCAIHTLQLVLDDCADIQKLVKDVLARASGLVTHFCCSTKAAEMLRQKQRELNIRETVLQPNQKTRWNSEFNLLHSLHVNKEAVKAAITELRLPNIHRLSEQDWNAISSLIELLAPFRTATLEFERDCACVSEVIPRLVWIEKKLQQAVALRLQTTKAALLRQVKARFYKDDIDDLQRIICYDIENIEAFAVATTLDPRFRQKYFEDSDAKRVAVDGIKGFLSNLRTQSVAEEPDTEVSPVEEEPSDSAPIRPRMRDTAAHASSWAGLDEDSDDEMRLDAAAEQPEITLDEEIASYLSEQNIAKDSNPFTWWRENEKRFPRLAIVAKCYLSAPAGNQSSESAFLVAKNICGGKRGSLLPENTRMLHFLKCNLPAIGYNTFSMST